MLLAIDIGNTNITFGVYQEDRLGPRWRLATDHERMPDEYGLQFVSFLQHGGVALEAISGVCLASVVPPVTGRIVEACRRYLHQEPLVVDAAAVQKLYGGPACVVDFGTATTFDAISAEGDYLGGAIAPGIGIAAEALFLRTAKLPRVDLQRPPNVIGKNTVHAMQSGLIFGYVALVEGMVARFRAELGEKMKVIATGGLAEVIAAETSVLQIIAPWLTLDGLNIIWKLNRT